MNLAGVQGVLLGFFAIFAIMLLGYLARRGAVVDSSAEKTLNQLAFFVATPALYFVLLATSDLGILFSTFTLASIIPMMVCALMMVLLLLVLRRRRTPSESALLAGSTIYANTGNIGIPVAIYVLGNASYVAPIILLQVLLISPTLLVILDLSQKRSGSIWRALSKPFVNPIIVASVMGLTVALTGFEVPDVILLPLDMLGDASIPMLLLAFGMSVFGARPLKETREYTLEIWLATAVKAVALPVLTLLTGVFLFGMSGIDLLALVIIAALSTAQTIYNFASQYGVLTLVSRDIVLITTALSAPIVIGFAAFLG